ncbi:MAG: hypothetical protein QXP42_00635 [Candidatus Micrarchaeia archaeon]
MDEKKRGKDIFYKDLEREIEGRNVSVGFERKGDRLIIKAEKVRGNVESIKRAIKEQVEKRRGDNEFLQLVEEIERDISKIEGELRILRKKLEVLRFAAEEYVSEPAAGRSEGEDEEQSEAVVYAVATGKKKEFEAGRNENNGNPGMHAVNSKKQRPEIPPAPDYIPVIEFSSSSDEEKGVRVESGWRDLYPENTVAFNTDFMMGIEKVGIAEEKKGEERVLEINERIAREIASIAEFGVQKESESPFEGFFGSVSSVISSFVAYPSKFLGKKESSEAQEWKAGMEPVGRESYDGSFEKAQTSTETYPVEESLEKPITMPEAPEYVPQITEFDIFRGKYLSLQSNRALTVEEIARITGDNEADVKGWLTRLVGEGVVKKVKRRKKGAYVDAYIILEK